MIVGADMLVKYRFVISDHDRHGNTRIYYRRGGKKFRILAEPGSEEFAKLYAEIAATFSTASFNGILPFSPGTLGWLVRQYQKSRVWLDLDKSTRRARSRIYDHILDEPGVRGEPVIYRDFPLNRITLHALEVLRDRKDDKPAAANERVKAIRRLFTWAVPKLVSPNPALDLKKRQYVTSGHHTWTLEEIEQFESHHKKGTKAFLAMQLLLYTGGRRSDVHRLGRQNARGGTLTWTAFKNRNRHPVIIEIPILPPLAEAIAAGPTGELVYLVTPYGKPYSVAGFGQWFKDRCIDAGLHHCSAHGIRKAAATILAENGATPHQLMAIFGWRTLAEAERYTQMARRKLMAAEGMRLMLEKNKVSHFLVPPGPVGQIGKKNQ